VTGVSPSSGPSTGGTSVTITGTNLTGASAVDFGGMAAASFTVTNDTSIKATSPAGSSTVDVHVTTGGGTSGVNQPGDEFTFNPPPPPTVTGLSPASGPAGTSVAITGSGFTGATAVHFGANPGSLTLNSDSSITATAPGGTGTVDVTVTTSGGTSAVNQPADQYTYTLPPAPTVTGVNPASGFNGTSVTVTGTSFTGATAVDFGANLATFSVNSDTSLTATAPGGTGTVDVTVTTSGGPSAVNQPADQYTYMSGPPPPTALTMYRGDLGRSGYYPAETGLTAANAPNLKLHWTDTGGIGTFAQPIAANNLVYWSDWRGIFHATNPSTGKDLWSANEGQTKITFGQCKGVMYGPSGAPVAADMSGTPVLFLPGGDDNLVALNATTGAQIWKTNVGSLGTDYLWSSPALYNGSLYEGIASVDDCPVIQGRLVQLDASTGVVLHTFNAVTSNCPGGGIWGSPAVDPSDGSIYVVTGNPTCDGTLAPAIVKLRASDLTELSHWTVPVSAQSQGDSDFGSTPVLFTATIAGQHRQLVGSVNKNGIFYAWDRANVGAGPVWQSTIAKPGGPATGSIVSAAWDGTNLYTGGGVASTLINGVSCSGSNNGTINALNPATGAFVWRTCQASNMYAGITEVPGVLVEGLNSGDVLFLSTATGHTLFDYKAPSLPRGESLVSNGVVYVPVGNTSTGVGNLIALGP
jgi:outer membrane protein assembly factor BamB